MVGLSYGLRKVHIRFKASLLAAAISFVGTYLSMLLGKGLLQALPAGLSNLIGGVIMILMGITGLLQKEKPIAKAVTLREAFLLGVMLTANNTGLGIGGGITGLPPLQSALGSFFLSLLFLYAGNKIGQTSLPPLFEAFAGPAAAILMILLGAFEIFV